MIAGVTIHKLHVSPNTVWLLSRSYTPHLLLSPISWATVGSWFCVTTSLGPPGEKRANTPLTPIPERKLYGIDGPSV